MIITKRFFIPLLLTLVRAEDGLVSRAKQQAGDLERDLFEELETKMDLFPERTDGKKAGGLRGLQNLTLNELSTEDLTGEGNPNPVFDSLGEDNILRNLDIEEDNVIPSTLTQLKIKHPEIASLVKKYYPLFDFDNDGCLPAAAIGRDGSKNGGLKPKGSYGGQCRSSNFMKRSNTYYRWAPIKGKGTIIMFALYFEKDQATLLGGGHRHDWEDVIIWIDENNNPKKVYWSAHGYYTGKNWADVPKQDSHPKIVYHKGGLGTRSFRLAKGFEVISTKAENPYGIWVVPPLVGWYEMTGNGLSNYQMRTKLNSFDYGGAHCGFKDGRFKTQIERAMGNEIDMSQIIFRPPEPIKVNNFGYDQGWRVEKHPRLLADVNGDGKLDIVGFGGSGVVVSTGGIAIQMLDTFGYNDGWRTEEFPRFLADMNGDGQADIVGFGAAGVYVAYSSVRTAEAFSAQTEAGYGDEWEIPYFHDSKKVVDNFGTDNGWRVDMHPRFVTDMNGDGKADIVGFGHYGVYVAYSNGWSFGEPKYVIKDFFCKGSGWDVAKHPRFLEDVNGDRKKDIIGFYDDGMYVSYSNANGGFDAPKRVIDNFGTDKGWSVDMHPRFVTDVNGDGKADFIGFGGNHVFVAYSNGNGFAPFKIVSNGFVYGKGWRVEKHPRFVEDVNGDGKKDIIGIGNYGMYVSYSNADGGFDAPKKINDSFGYNDGWRIEKHPRFVADVNGNGKADIVVFDNSGVFIIPLAK